MANNLNLRRTVQEAWPELMSGTSLKYPSAMRSLSGPSGTISFGGYAVGGIATTIADSATADPAAQNFGSFSASFATVEKVVTHSFPTHLGQSELGILEQLGQFAKKCAANIDLDAFSGLEGLFTANAPRAGVGVGQCGGGKLFFDTGKDALLTEPGTFKYDNKTAADFSETALDAAMQLMLKWKDDRGLPMNLGRGPLKIICATGDVKLVHEVIRSALSGADMAANYYAGKQIDVIDWAFTDDDAWLLVDGDNIPFGYYLAKLPEVKVTLSEKETITHFVGTYNGCFVYSPYEYGAVASLQ
jgi:hypothetical protein